VTDDIIEMEMKITFVSAVAHFGLADDYDKQFKNWLKILPNTHFWVFETNEKTYNWNGTATKTNLGIFMNKA
jgi:hypothetical protein